MSEYLIKPGSSLGHYPQRTEATLDDFEAVLHHWGGKLRARLGRGSASQRSIARRVHRYDAELQSATENELDAAIEELRRRLHRQGLLDRHVIDSFAVVREIAARTLDKRHYDEQLFGGWLIMKGMLAEMQTGEGKTLTTTLPACTAALAGVPVHVITANDYLARRDCESMQPLYHRLGLTSNWVVEGMSPEECRAAYRADIVHTTNKQIAFDYLRDRIEMGDDTGDLRFQYRELKDRLEPGKGSNLMLRGLCFAIVDEADSVLIDEANTPLIITRKIPGEDTPETYSDALYLASALQPGLHFRADEQQRVVELTLAGQDRIEQQIDSLPRVWRNSRRRETLVRQALAARLFYQRDRDYLVHQEKIQIIDQSTGRRMPDRAWEQGLQQMVEAKEGCLISEQREPLARISYQRFFSRYLRLGGTSGTLAEVAPELQRVYGLQSRRVNPHRPSRRISYGLRVFPRVEDKQRALVERVRAMHRAGRPVLVGTCTVEESEQVSGWLQLADLPHRVLNARQDQLEAQIIARAGDRGAITVATNMAGRGTDIALGPGVEEIGGLHVISLNLNPTQRLDRQLFGRAARQGDPGSSETLLSLGDHALANCRGSTMLKLIGGLCAGGKPLYGWVCRPFLNLAQNRHEAQQARIRKMLMKQDRHLRRVLAFAGRFE